MVSIVKSFKGHLWPLNSPHVLGVQTVHRRNDLSPSVGGVVPGLAVVRWKGYNRSSRKSQPPLGDFAVKGAVRQRGAFFKTRGMG